MHQNAQENSLPKNKQIIRSIRDIEKIIEVNDTFAFFAKMSISDNAANKMKEWLTLPDTKQTETYTDMLEKGQINSDGTLSEPMEAIVALFEGDFIDASCIMDNKDDTYFTIKLSTNKILSKTKRMKQFIESKCSYIDCHIMLSQLAMLARSPIIVPGCIFTASISDIIASKSN